MNTYEEKLNELFEALVPVEGRAVTVAGEIVRAICRIAYRNYNDGDHIGVGYGKETCNAAARFLAKKCNDRVARCVGDAWGIYGEAAYDAALEALEQAVLAYLEQHPELATTYNEDDYWDYGDPYEDREDYDDEDDPYACGYYDEEWEGEDDE